MTTLLLPEITADADYEARAKKLHCGTEWPLMDLDALS